MFPYSKWGRTRDLNRRGSVWVPRSSKERLMTPSIWLALLTATRLLPELQLFIDDDAQVPLFRDALN